MTARQSWEVMAELLTGRCPFPMEDTAAAIHAHPAVPATLVTAIATAMAKGQQRTGRQVC